jgi:hypothetical protein
LAGDELLPRLRTPSDPNGLGLIGRALSSTPHHPEVANAGSDAEYGVDVGVAAVVFPDNLATLGVGEVGFVAERREVVTG